MALRKSTQSLCRMNAPSGIDGVHPVSCFGQHIIKTGEFALNDVIEMVPFPAGMIPVAIHLKAEDSDSNGTPTVTLDVGIMTGAWLEATVGNDGTTARTVGTEFAAASTIAQAGGVLDVTKDKLIDLVAAKQVDRSIGIKVAAAAATLTAGAKLTMHATFIPSPVGQAMT